MTEVKVPRRMAWRVMTEKKHSTRLSHVSTITLLSRGVAHVIDQGPGLVLFYSVVWLVVVVTRGRVVCLGR